MFHHSWMAEHAKNKVDAIFELRDAAEEKAHAERDLAEAPSPQRRDALLEAQMTLAEKTHDAIEVCHECGGEHGTDQPHVRR